VVILIVKSSNILLIMANEFSSHELEDVVVPAETVAANHEAKRTAHDVVDDDTPGQPYKRFKNVSEEEQCKWSLPDRMAERVV